MKIYSLSRLVNKWLDIIEEATGDRPEDWLFEIAERTKEDVETDEAFEGYDFEEKWELIEDNLHYYTYDYIDFIKANYPERIKKED